MFVEVHAETSLSWEIDYDNGSGKQSAILRMDGGAWYLTPSPQAGDRWIAGPRIDWPEALKRALVALAPRVS